MHSLNNLATWAVSFWFVSTITASCIHGTTMYKHALSKRADIGKFGYTDRLSPINWANLFPENAACATSLNQSPINLDDTIQFAKEVPKIDFPLVDNMTLLNIGTTVEVEFDGDGGGGTTSIGNQTFRLNQFHFHTPSEHRVNGEYFPVEMHMVHENIGSSLKNMANRKADNTSLVVLALLFQLSTGPGVPFLDSIVSGLPAIVAPGSETRIQSIDLSPAVDLLTNSSVNTFTYVGSLTTPPCSEGLPFFIPNERLPISVSQFNTLKSVLKFNSRYTQNALGDGNLLQIAKGNDTNPQETLQQLHSLDGEDKFK